jgi:hypothetical protein
MATVLSNTEVTTAELTEIPTSRLWRLSVEQYHEMLRAGILREDDPVELIEGVLVQKVGKNPPHVVALTLLRDLLLRLNLSNWTVRIQDPIALGESEPEPDIVLVRGTIGDYRDRHPDAEDIGIVVEVSDASLSDDRDFKKQLYARHGISQYCIVNLVDGQVEVCTEPFATSLNSDCHRRILYSPDQMVPLVLDGVECAAISVRDLLP